MVQDRKERKSGGASSADDSMESAASHEYDSDIEDSMMAIEPPHIYFFGAELTKESPDYTWEVSTTSADGNDESMLTGDDDDAMKHILKLRQICLGKGAKAGERNIVELEASAPDGELVSYTIASLTVGVQEMGQLQLDFEGSVPITMKLVEGSGPVCITGNHEMSLEYELEDNGELDATADNIEDLSEAEDVKSPRAAKRQKTGKKTLSHKKADQQSEEEEEEDESAEVSGQDEAEPEQEEEMEEDEQESEEEEEDSPKPKEKKQEMKKKSMNGNKGAKSPKDLQKAKQKAKKQMIKKSKKLTA